MIPYSILKGPGVKHQLTDERKAQLTVVHDFSHYENQAKLIRAEMGTTPKYKTGWHRFDDYIGRGFGSDHRGELVVIVGESKIGKTTFMGNLALRIINNSSESIYYISLEDQYADVYNTMAAVAKLDSLRSIHKKLKTPDEKFIFDENAWDADELIFHMEHVYKTYGVKLFFLDHLNFMFENEEHLENETRRIRVVMRKLSRFCVYNRVTVFAISHINRNKSANEGKLLTNDRIYGSGSIAQAATKVLILQRAQDLPGYFVDVRLTASRYTRPDPLVQAVRFKSQDYRWEYVQCVTL